MAEYIDITLDISEEEFSGVQVKCIAADLEISRSEDKFAHIICRNVPEGSFAIAENGKLVAEVKRPKVTDMIFKNHFQASSCRISLPEKQYDSFTADIAMGNSSICDVGCDSAEINSGSGNLNISRAAALKDMRINSGAGQVIMDNTECGELKIKTGAGNITVNDVNIRNAANIEGGTGEITIDRLESGMLRIRSGTGNIRAKGTASGLDIQGGIGNTRFEGSVSGDIDIRGGIGNIDLVLDEKSRSEHRLKTTHGIGKVNIEYI